MAKKTKEPTIDAIGEFIDAGTQYILALIDARQKDPVERLNHQIMATKANLREKVEALLQMAASINR